MAACLSSRQGGAGASRRSGTGSGGGVFGLGDAVVDEEDNQIALGALAEDEEQLSAKQRRNRRRRRRRREKKRESAGEALSHRHDDENMFDFEDDLQQVDMEGLGLDEDDGELRAGVDETAGGHYYHQHRREVSHHGSETFSESACDVSDSCSCCESDDSEDGADGGSFDLMSPPRHAAHRLSRHHRGTDSRQFNHGGVGASLPVDLFTGAPRAVSASRSIAKKDSEGIEDESSAVSTSVEKKLHPIIGSAPGDVTGHRHHGDCNFGISWGSVEVVQFAQALPVNHGRSKKAKKKLARLAQQQEIDAQKPVAAGSNGKGGGRKRSSSVGAAMPRQQTIPTVPDKQGFVNQFVHDDETFTMGKSV